MKRSFVPPHDPILRQIAQEVPLNEITSEETKNSIEEMLDIAYGNRVDRTKPTVVGLAAPQIGISKRIILVDIGADGHGGLANVQVFINPEIISQSEEKEEWCEGCWSTDRVAGVVSRAKTVRISAYNQSGEKVENGYGGYVAKIFQHEIDHLNGQEFINRITAPEKLHWVEVEEWTEYKAKEGWRNWPKKCTFERWERIKGIK